MNQFDAFRQSFLLPTEKEPISILADTNLCFVSFRDGTISAFPPNASSPLFQFRSKNPLVLKIASVLGSRGIATLEKDEEGKNHVYVYVWRRVPDQRKLLPSSFPTAFLRKGPTTESWIVEATCVKRDVHITCVESSKEGDILMIAQSAEMIEFFKLEWRKRRLEVGEIDETYQPALVCRLKFAIWTFGWDVISMSMQGDLIIYACASEARAVRTCFRRGGCDCTASSVHDAAHSWHIASEEDGEIDHDEEESPIGNELGDKFEENVDSLVDLMEHIEQQEEAAHQGRAMSPVVDVPPHPSQPFCRSIDVPTESRRETMKFFLDTTENDDEQQPEGSESMVSRSSGEDEIMSGKVLSRRSRFLDTSSVLSGQGTGGVINPVFENDSGKLESHMLDMDGYVCGMESKGQKCGEEPVLLLSPMGIGRASKGTTSVPRAIFSAKGDFVGIGAVAWHEEDEAVSQDTFHALSVCTRCFPNLEASESILLFQQKSEDREYFRDVHILQRDGFSTLLAASTSQRVIFFRLVPDRRDPSVIRAAKLREIQFFGENIHSVVSSHFLIAATSPGLEVWSICSLYDSEDGCTFEPTELDEIREPLMIRLQPMFGVKELHMVSDFLFALCKVSDTEDISVAAVFGSDDPALDSASPRPDEEDTRSLSRTGTDEDAREGSEQSDSAQNWMGLFANIHSTRSMERGHLSALIVGKAQPEGQISWNLHELKMESITLLSKRICRSAGQVDENDPMGRIRFHYHAAQMLRTSRMGLASQTELNVIESMALQRMVDVERRIYRKMCELSLLCCPDESIRLALQSDLTFEEAILLLKRDENGSLLVREYVSRKLEKRVPISTKGFSEESACTLLDVFSSEDPGFVAIVLLVLADQIRSPEECVTKLHNAEFMRTSVNSSYTKWEHGLPFSIFVEGVLRIIHGMEVVSHVGVSVSSTSLSSHDDGALPREDHASESEETQSFSKSVPQEHHFNNLDEAALVAMYLDFECFLSIGSAEAVMDYIRSHMPHACVEILRGLCFRKRCTFRSAVSYLKGNVPSILLESFLKRLILEKSFDESMQEKHAFTSLIMTLIDRIVEQKLHQDILVPMGAMQEYEFLTETLLAVVQRRYSIGTPRWIRLLVPSSADFNELLTLMHPRVPQQGEQICEFVNDIVGKTEVIEEILLPMRVRAAMNIGDYKASIDMLSSKDPNVMIALAKSDFETSDAWFYLIERLMHMKVDESVMMDAFAAASNVLSPEDFLKLLPDDEPLTKYVDLIQRCFSILKGYMLTSSILQVTEKYE